MPQDNPSESDTSRNCKPELNLVSTWVRCIQLQLVVNSSLPEYPEVTIGITAMMSSEESSKSANFTRSSVSAVFEPRIDTHKHEYKEPQGQPVRVDLCSFVVPVSVRIKSRLVSHTKSPEVSSKIMEAVYRKRLPSVDSCRSELLKNFLTDETVP